MKNLLAQLQESLQDNIITCVDGNLEGIISNQLLARDVEKLKTDLCALVCEEIAKHKEEPE